MLIEYGSGSSGIIEYLEKGHKKGREYSRDEADKRVCIGGDIGTLDEILKGSKFGYKHITISAKEDDISKEEFEKISKSYIDKLMIAHKKDEFYLYNEIHFPKIKSYRAKNGELVIRKPHLHIVIPEINLVTGKKLEVGGHILSNVEYLDSIQETINIEGGYASPKKNRSNRIGDERFDHLFTNRTDAKQEIMKDILENDISNFNELKSLLNEKYGTATIGRKGKQNEYLQIKLKHEDKNIRLKEYVFGKEFLAFSKEEKIEFLSKTNENEEYIEKEDKSQFSDKEIEKYKKTLEYWLNIKSLEVKYINRSTNFYKKKYSEYSQDEKKIYLENAHKQFYINNNINLDIKNFISSFTPPTPPTPQISHQGHTQNSVIVSKLQQIKENRYYSNIDYTNLNMNDIYTFIKNDKGLMNSKYQYDTTLNSVKVGSHNNVSIGDFMSQYMYLSIKDVDKYINQSKENTMSKFTDRLSTESEKVISLGKNTHAFMNAFLLENNGFSYKNLDNFIEVLKAKSTMTKEKVDQQVDKLETSFDKNIKMLIDQNILKKVGNKLEFTSEQAKEKLAENLTNTNKITQTQQRPKKEKEHIIEAELEEPAKKSQEVQKERIRETSTKAPIAAVASVASVPVFANIVANAKDNTKADYYQLGSEDVAGRFSGVIHDQASKLDTAVLYVINDKQVSLDVFREQKPKLLESIDIKKNELFNIDKQIVYNDKLRVEVVKEVVNMNRSAEAIASGGIKQLTGIEVGLTKFDKKIDKNFFTLAKEFVTAKGLRDTIKVAIDEFKQKRVSRTDLAASNIVLAAQLKQQKIEMDNLKSYHAAQEVMRRIESQNQNVEQNKNVEEEEEEEKSFKDYVVELKNVFDKVENISDRLNQVRDIYDKMNDETFEKAQKVVKLLHNNSKENISNALTDTLLDTTKEFDFEKIDAANIMIKNSIQITDEKSIDTVKDIVIDATKTAIESQIDVSSFIDTVMTKMSQNQNKEQQQDAGMEM